MSVRDDVPEVCVALRPGTDPCCCGARLGAAKKQCQGGAAQSAPTQPLLYTQMVGIGLDLVQAVPPTLISA